MVPSGLTVMEGTPAPPRGWRLVPWYLCTHSCLPVVALYATVTSFRRPIDVLAVMPVTYTTALSGLAATELAVADTNAPPNRCSHTCVPPGTAVLRWPVAALCIAPAPEDAAAAPGTAMAKTPVAASVMMAAGR